MGCGYLVCGTNQYAGRQVSQHISNTRHTNLILHKWVVPYKYSTVYIQSSYIISFSYVYSINIHQQSRRYMTKALFLMPVEIVFIAKWMTHKRSSLLLQMKFLYSVWIEHQNQRRVHSNQLLIQTAKSLFKDRKYSWSRVHTRIKILKPVKVGLSSIKLKVTTFTLSCCTGRHLMETLMQQSFSMKNFHVYIIFI